MNILNKNEDLLNVVKSLILDNENITTSYKGKSDITNDIISSGIIENKLTKAELDNYSFLMENRTLIIGELEITGMVSHYIKNRGTHFDEKRIWKGIFCKIDNNNSMALEKGVYIKTTERVHFLIFLMLAILNTFVIFFLLIIVLAIVAELLKFKYGFDGLILDGMNALILASLGTLFLGIIPTIIGIIQRIMKLKIEIYKYYDIETNIKLKNNNFEAYVHKDMQNNIIELSKKLYELKIRNMQVSFADNNVYLFFENKSFFNFYSYKDREDTVKNDMNFIRTIIDFAKKN